MDSALDRLNESLERLESASFNLSGSSYSSIELDQIGKFSGATHEIFEVFLNCFVSQAEAQNVPKRRYRAIFATRLDGLALDMYLEMKQALGLEITFEYVVEKFKSVFTLGLSKDITP